MRNTATIVLLLLTGYTLFLVTTWRLNDGFRLSHIQSDASALPTPKSISTQDEAIKNLLKQNFYYLGKGSQCYVFESEDHDVVLKFFRYPRYRSHPINNYITAPQLVADAIQRKTHEKQEKLKALFASCRLAHQELREETGLVYLHLNKTHHLKQTVVLYDKLKRPYPITIDNYEFLIQKKGEQTFKYLTRLLEQGKREEAKEALAALSATLKKSLQKGIIDNDAMIHKNAGFRNQKALILDVGGFELKSPPADPESTLWQLTRRLRAWLHAQDPELARSFEQSLRCHPNKTPPQIVHKIPSLLQSIF